VLSEVNPWSKHRTAAFSRGNSLTCGTRSSQPWGHSCSSASS
jgi:hypothetical protein